MSEAANEGAPDFELDVLAVFSHPDDAELTAGGTLLKLKSLGRTTGVLDMTRGEMGTRGTPEQRFEEARAAAEIMRLDVRLNLDQPDGHVFVTDEARTALVRVIRTYRPKVILTAHWDDPHPDHAATARLAREAARLASMRRYDEGAGQAAVAMPALAHGDIDQDKLAEVVRYLCRRNFHWEFNVTNVSMIYDTGREQGVRCRFDFKGE